jgi:hypothetical protein
MKREAPPVKATGIQYWVEGFLKEKDHSRIRRAILRPDDIAIDYEDSHASDGTNQVKLARRADGTFAGRYVAGTGDDQEIGEVTCEVFHNQIGAVLLGTWRGASGDYVWLVRLETVSSFDND